MIVMRFWRAEEGAVAIYMALTTVVMLGFGALVVNLGRVFTYQTELQKAVDASALAAAAELDGTAGAISRARMAAKDALVNNRQTFGAGGPEVDFTDSDIRFLSALPASDDSPITSAFETTDDADARFVEVRASARPIGFFLAPVFAHRVGGDGGPEQTEGETSAVAVAGFNQVVCDFPPLMICNPAEVNGNTGTPFEANAGELILLKSKGGSGHWGPGNFGLLDPPQGNQGTSEIQENLASANPSGCFTTQVDTRTGSAQNPVSKAINVRFDMYENPGFKNEDDNPDYRPAPNVTKGKYKQGNKWEDYTGSPPAGMGMPLHDCLEADTCDQEDPSFHERFAPPPGWAGQGVPYDTPAVVTFWEDYWSINHPDLDMPGGFLLMATNGDLTHGPIDTNGDGTVTRMEMYDWEIDNNEIPINVDPGDPSDSSGENGNPTEYSGGVAPNRERRVMPVAVVNCDADGPVQGNTSNLPVTAFAKMFLTHAAEAGSEQTIYAEMVGTLQPGVDDVLHDIVQLYR